MNKIFLIFIFIIVFTFIAIFKIYLFKKRKYNLVNALKANYFIETLNNLIEENKYNLYLILIVFILFSNNYMYQKYLEPLWLILFFLVMNSKIFSDFIKSQKQIFLVLSYFILYYAAAISNSVFKISLNHFW